MQKNIRPYTKSEEIMNCLAHGAGAVFSVVATIVLVTLSAIHGNVWAIIGSAVFGISAICMYTASTVYHAATDPDRRIKLKKFDHISIYYLIAGTYTPFLLVTLHGTLGWIMLGVIWALAFFGTYLKLKSSVINGAKLWSIGLYLLMGWLMVFASTALIEAMPPRALNYLALGGIFYTVGIVFYVWKSKKYTHAIWHAFVLAGTVMHFFAVLYGTVLV